MHRGALEGNRETVSRKKKVLSSFFFQSDRHETGVFERGLRALYFSVSLTLSCNSLSYPVMCCLFFFPYPREEKKTEEG